MSPSLSPSTAKDSRLVRAARRAACLAAAAAIGFFTRADAATIAFQADGIPGPNWSTSAYHSGGALQEQTTLHGKTWYLITRTSDDNNPHQVMYNGGHLNNGNPVAHPDNQLADFAGSVIIGSSRWENYITASVVLRSGSFAFRGETAYHLIVTGEGLGLYWGVGGSLGLPAPLAFAPLTDGFQLAALTAEDDNAYLLKFSFIGNNLKASLWTIDETGAAVGDAVASLDYTDLRPDYRESGYFGIRGGRFAGNRNAFFRDVNVTVIPEPGAASLLLVPVAAAGLLILRRRK